MNPLLKPMPMSPEEIADLIQRARAAMYRAAVYAGRLQRRREKSVSFNEDVS